MVKPSKIELIENVEAPARFSTENEVLQGLCRKVREVITVQLPVELY